MNQSKGRSSDDLALNYFSIVNESKAKALYDVYKKDFFLFDYDPEPFFKVSRNNMLQTRLQRETWPHGDQNFRYNVSQN